MVLKSLNLPCSPSGPTSLTQGPQSSHHCKTIFFSLKPYASTRQTHSSRALWSRTRILLKPAFHNLQDSSIEPLPRGLGHWWWDWQVVPLTHVCFWRFPFFSWPFFLLLFFLVFLSNKVKRCFCILFLFRLNVVICLFVFLELQNRSKIVCFFGGKKWKAPGKFIAKSKPILERKNAKKNKWKHAYKIKNDFGTQKKQKEKTFFLLGERHLH